MKAGICNIILYVFLISVKLHAQCPELTTILQSDASLEIKKERIDSLFQEIGQNQNRSLADCYHDLGNQWYYRNWRQTEFPADLENAVKYTRKATDLKSHLPHIDTASLKQSLYNLGFFQRKRGTYFEALESYEEILRLGGEHLNLSAKRAMGEVDIQIGDFQKAIEIFEEIIETYNSDPNRWEPLLETYILIADAYGFMDYVKYERELEHWLDKAELLLKEKNLEDSFEKNQIRILRGNLFLKTGKFDNAIVEYKEILAKPTGFFPKALAITYNNLGFCLLKTNDLKNSEEYLLKSISLDSSYSDPYENLGDLYLEGNEFEKGMYNYQKAINLTLGATAATNKAQLPSVENLELIPNKLKMFDHLVAKGHGWMEYYEFDGKKDHLDHALKSYTLADKLADVIQFENTEFQSKFHWREKGSKLYMNAVKVCYLMDEPEMAFYFMERNKALLLLKDLSNEEAKEVAQIPVEKAQREFHLKQALFLSENRFQKLKGAVSPDSLTILKQSVRDQKHNYERFLDSLNSDYPDYAKFKRKVDVVSFKDLKANYITENKATLHYILNEEDGYGLLTTADTLGLFRLHNIPDLNEQVEQLTGALSNPLSNSSHFKAISNAVFQELVPKNVYRNIKGRQLTIIPDYTLQQIPFESLVVDNAKLEYLFQDVEIAYAYSASLLDYNQKERKDSNIHFLGIAPITFDRIKLAELYFSENEIKNIAKVYDGETLMNGQASKANFIKNANTHNILHLATHADIGDGDNPWIAFYDSKMYLKEIYATKNRADMVVLSGCNTSNGELKRGEGVMSLARGFFYSGAKSVVSTLWPVADEAGKDILIDFYKNLSQGNTKSKALQKAKLDYLENTEEEELKHPYYWAGFVVLGDNSPISDKPISPWLFLACGALGAGIVVFGYKKIKAHRAAA